MNALNFAQLGSIVPLADFRNQFQSLSGGLFLTGGPTECHYGETPSEPHWVQLGSSKISNELYYGKKRLISQHALNKKLSVLRQNTGISFRLPRRPEIELYYRGGPINIAQFMNKTSPLWRSRVHQILSKTQETGELELETPEEKSILKLLGNFINLFDVTRVSDKKQIIFPSGANINSHPLVYSAALELLHAGELFGYHKIRPKLQRSTLYKVSPLFGDTSHPAMGTLEYIRTLGASSRQLPRPSRVTKRGSSAFWGVLRSKTSDGYSYKTYHMELSALLFHLRTPSLQELDPNLIGFRILIGD